MHSHVAQDSAAFARCHLQTGDSRIYSFAQCTTRTWNCMDDTNFLSYAPFQFLKHYEIPVLLSTRAWVGPYSHTCFVSAKGLSHIGGKVSATRLSCFSLWTILHPRGVSRLSLSHIRFATVEHLLPLTYSTEGICSGPELSDSTRAFSASLSSRRSRWLSALSTPSAV